MKDIDETKRTHHRPWCGDDAYALGWGVIKPQAMVGAKAALRHGDISVPQHTVMMVQEGGEILENWGQLEPK